MLDDVEPLWEKLHGCHKSLSPNNSQRMASSTFVARKEGFIQKTNGGKLRVELVRSGADDIFIGYCVSTIDEAMTGEVDSIFVEEAHRGKRVSESANGKRSGMDGGPEGAEQNHCRVGRK